MSSVQLSVRGPAEPLGATLEIPDGPAPFPGVVLVSGSGPLDRDSNYKRFRFGVSQQLAAALREAGIASLRFDKRGVGVSDLDWRSAGLIDNADDVVAAIDALRARPEIRSDAVLVIGHSEGAVLAGMVAARGVPVAGVGLLSGSARTGRDLLVWQAQALLPTLPRPVRFLLRLLRIDIAALQAKSFAKITATTGDVARVGVSKLNAKWMREFLAHDAAADLRLIRQPVLAVTGSKDLQSPPEDALRIAELVGPGAEAHVVADVTHTLRRQPAAPSLRRYKKEVQRPLDADVVGLVVGWAVRVTQRVAAPDAS